ncbi:MAG: hypothetical protein HQL26_11060 [Candidatus Omnitrophica bacterium]|nr:hypothetical protein [Candidatus Omnitrophota bacterium]
MNKNKYIALLMLIGFFILSYSAQATEEETRVALGKCQNHFPLTISIVPNDSDYSPASKVFTFLITSSQNMPVNARFKLHYFLGRLHRQEVADITLPYKFQQTYRGMFPGSYRVDFLLQDASGTCTESGMDITVP